MTLDLDLDTTTVAAVKAAVDTHLEALWQASGVRILRSDLPFRGIKLIYRGRVLALDRVLSSCRVGSGSTLYAQWPQEDGKDARRKRYGQGGESKAVFERRRGTEREGQEAGRKDQNGPAKRRVSGVVENSPRSESEAGGDEQSASACVSDDGPVDDIDIDIEPEGDLAGVGGEAAQRLGWEIVEEVQNAQQEVEEEVQGERPTEEADQDDQLADNDNDKENREPLLIPIVQVRVDHDRAEEWSGFDESNSGVGVDLREEVLEF